MNHNEEVLVQLLWAILAQRMLAKLIKIRKNRKTRSSINLFFVYQTKTQVELYLELDEQATLTILFKVSY